MRDLRFSNWRMMLLIATLVALALGGCNQATVAPATQPSESNSPTHPANEPPASAPVQPTPTPQPTMPALTAPTQGPYLPALPVWGIEMYTISPDTGLDLVKQSGAYWVRRNALLWSEVEPVEGQRNWAALAGLEEELKAAAGQSLQTILIVRSTPEWAQSFSGSLCSVPKQEKLAAFGAFMQDVVRRYSVPPYSVQYWEIGNEPDVAPELIASDSPFGCWGETNDPYYGGEYYAEVLKAIYAPIKAANPQAQVLVGGLLLNCDPVNPPETEPGSGVQRDCTPSRYLEGILENDGARYFDGISYHAYDYYGGAPGQYSNGNWNSAWDSTGPSLIAKADYLRGLLNLYGVQGKYLINSEVALLCGRDGTEPECQAEDFRLTKAYFAAQAYASAIAKHLMANVWYSLTGWRGTGLVDSSMQPNDAYQAFQASVARLSGAGYLGPLDDYPGVRGEVFERDDRTVWILWSLDGAEHAIQLERSPAAAFDVLGAPFEATQELTITVAPVYLEFTK